LTSVRAKLQEHPLLYFGGVGLAAVGVIEVYLLRLGAPPLAMAMAITVGVPVYCITVVVVLHMAKRNAVQDASITRDD
jgi:hypothetical protein